MSTTLTPAISEIRSTFSLSITEHGGTVSDTYQKQDFLIMRAILRQTDEVAPTDTFNSGVAIKCSGPSLEIYPYVFRQVCTNGAIMAQSCAAHQLGRFESWQHDESDVLLRLSEVVADCATGDAFSTFVNQLRNARSRAHRDVMGLILSMLSMMPGSRDTRTRIVDSIVQDFALSEDQSAYGLMNAVTATARDTTDPETKWELEKIGGFIPARLLQPEPSRRATAMQRA